MRNNLSHAEKMLWRHLHQKQLGNNKFRCQYRVGKYVVDFYCSKAKLAIEIDDGAQLYDRAQEDYLRSLGVTLMRFTHTEVYRNRGEIMSKIYLYLTHRYLPPPLPAPQPRPSGKK
ncbi:MAG: endonuclease domain-containing protein [Patescibacteria group bacterium]|nr:endonuclease domain-containing protein [Patescibacteria group bacterium]